MRNTYLNYLLWTKDVGNKVPVIMYHISMFKKDQEITSNNNYLDNYLFNIKTTGVSTDRSIKTSIKYVPNMLPSHPKQICNVSNIHIK